MATTVARLTLAEVSDGGGPPGRWEIIEGELIEVPPAGGRHGRIGSSVHGILWQYNRREKAGIVYGPDTGFILRTEPLLLRVPDVAFVSSERLPADFDAGGYLQVAPDLVAEVVSPSDRSLDVLAKVVMWLEHGTRLVWVIDPAQATVAVYPAAAAPTILTSADTLTGGDVLPDLDFAVAEIFAR